MTDCYAHTDIEADLSAQGAGTGYGLIGSSEPRGRITNSYSSGHTYRGLSSSSSSMSVNSSYYDKEKITNEYRSTGTGKTTAEMKQQATYEGWDFENVWGISASINDGYPYLRLFHPALRGDVNGDGKVDMDDATFVTNIILGTADATEAADVNNDGQVSMPDAMFIVNKVLNGNFPDE